MTIWGKRAQALAAAAGAVLMAASPAWAATAAANLFYQRSVMAAADRACKLFEPPVSSALTAAKLQARGAALRSGMDAASLKALETQASAAALGAGCRSPDITVAAQQVKKAFDGYAQLSKMRYPGETTDWVAERTIDDRRAHWRLSQRVRIGWDTMVFGIVGNGQARPLMAVASFADGAEPYAARLILRDASSTSGPYLARNEADIRGRIPLDGRLPPRSASVVFTAEAMSPAGGDLRPADLATGWAFRFPDQAQAALAELDPREAVAVEFLFAGDREDEARTAYVEVGDFAAGRAFETLAQR
ncbi:MAG: hypothetical protein ACHP7N_01280 [Caulobacterales bacterium]